jgi:hypothetical protein
MTTRPHFVALLISIEDANDTEPLVTRARVIRWILGKDDSGEPTAEALLLMPDGRLEYSSHHEFDYGSVRFIHTGDRLSPPVRLRYRQKKDDGSAS